MLRKILFQIHLWCGIVLGAFLAFQSVTGSAVVLRHEGNRWLHREEMIVVPRSTPQIPMSGVLDSFAAAYPRIPLNVVSVMYPQAPDEAYFIRVWYNAPSPNFYVSIDPYTGKITGDGSKYQYPFELMFRLHEQLSMGTPGIKIVHASGFLLMLMSLTGIYLWWPRRESLKRALKIERRPFKRFLLELHRVVGAYAFVAVFIVALSGTMFMGLLSLLPVALPPSGLNAFAGAALDQNPTGTPVPVDQLITTAKSYFPNDPIRDLSYIRVMRRVAVVSFIDVGNANVRALNRVFFERHTGRVLAVVDAAETSGIPMIEQGSLPYHTGDVIGVPGRAIVFLSGLAMPLLFVTGLWSWLGRRQRRVE